MAAWKNDPELLLNTSYHMNFGEEWIKENQAFINTSVERYAALDMAAFSRLMEAFYKLDITERLPEIKVPTLVVAGEDDLIKGRAYAEIIAKNIPQSEYLLVPGSGHALCLDKPAELNSLILGFVMKNTDYN
jgi:3-oxoadipate enol-lactonase